MKKELLKTVTVCDKCGTDENVWTKCLRCGAEHCYECKETCGVEYNHAVHFQGSGDGYYCYKCDDHLKEAGDNKLHSAYLDIKRLRFEEKSWWEHFKIRQEIAEDQVKILVKL